MWCLFCAFLSVSGLVFLFLWKQGFRWLVSAHSHVNPPVSNSNGFAGQSPAPSLYSLLDIKCQPISFANLRIWPSACAWLRGYPSPDTLIPQQKAETTVNACSLAAGNGKQRSRSGQEDSRRRRLLFSKAVRELRGGNLSTPYRSSCARTWQASNDNDT